MFIRKMKADDIDQLAELYKQFWDNDSNLEKMNEQFEKFDKGDTNILFSALDEDGKSGKLIGSIMGIICEEIYGECKPFMVVEDLIVHKDYRGKEIGKHLMNSLELVAKKRGCSQIILVTESERLDACGFYEAYGFQKDIKGYKKVF